MLDKNKRRDAKPKRRFTRPKASSGGSAFQLDDAHSEKIASLNPHLIGAVHGLLKSHGVDAVVHSISFRPANAVAGGGGPCGPQPCCYVNGVWTCFG